MFELKSYNVRLLSPRLRSLASVCLIIHFGILFATLSTAAVKSTIRDRLLDIVMPYTAATHIHLGGRAIADVTHSTADWLHQFEYRLQPSSSWTATDLDIGNPIGGHRRFERYLATIAEASEQEDTATAAMLAEPLVNRLVAQLSKQQQTSQSHSIKKSKLESLQIRVVAIVHKADRAIDAIRVPNEETRWAIFQPPQPVVRWQAGVVEKTNSNQSVGNEWSVVFLEEPRLNAKAVTSQSDAMGRGESLRDNDE